MTTTKQTLPEAIADFSAKLQRIEKRGVAPAAMGGFPFVRTTDVMDALKPELDARGIILRPQYTVLGEPLVRPRGETGYTLLLTVELELFAVRDGDELLLARTIGMGSDTQDKASGKAQTSALKEAILKAFAIPTGDDPEAFEQPAEQPRRQRSQQRSERTQSTRSHARPGDKASAINRLNALLKDVDKLDSQTVNRYSIKAHVRKTSGHETVGELIGKGELSQLVELIEYIEAKLDDPQPDDDATERHAEQMSDDDALAAGAALAGRS
jgi:hypothetical protein